MKNFYFFGLAFFPIAVGLTVGFIVYDLFDPSDIGNLVLKSTGKGIIIGALFGLFNLFLKIGPFNRTK